MDIAGKDIEKRYLEDFANSEAKKANSSIENSPSSEQEQKTDKTNNVNNSEIIDENDEKIKKAIKAINEKRMRIKEDIDINQKSLNNAKDIDTERYDILNELLRKTRELYDMTLETYHLLKSERYSDAVSKKLEEINDKKKYNVFYQLDFILSLPSSYTLDDFIKFTGVSEDEIKYELVNNPMRALQIVIDTYNSQQLFYLSKIKDKETLNKNDMNYLKETFDGDINNLYNKKVRLAFEKLEDLNNQIGANKLPTIEYAISVRPILESMLGILIIMRKFSDMTINACFSIIRGSEKIVSNNVEENENLMRENERLQQENEKLKVRNETLTNSNEILNSKNINLTNQIKYKEQQLKEYDKRIEYFGKDKPKIGLDFGDKSDKIIPSEKQIESMENATIKDAATDDDVDTDNDNPVASDDDETTV
jgi:hypothetical protein